MQTYWTTIVGQHVMQDLRNRLYEHLQSMSLRFFTATRTGDLQSRLQNDVGGVQNVVTNTASSTISNVVIVLSTVAAMLWLSWQLTLLALIVVPIFALLTWRVGRARRKISKETQQSLAELSALTEETLSVSGVLLTKVFGRRTDAVARYRTRAAGSPGCRCASRWWAARSSRSCRCSSRSPRRSSTSWRATRT